MTIRPLMIAAGFLLSTATCAQTPAPASPTTLPYGPGISLADARTCAAAVAAEATKNGWFMVTTVVDSGGHVVLTERMDNAMFGSVQPALEKAQGAAAFRRPTKVFEDMIAQGGVAMRVMTLPGVLPIAGGQPLVRDGKIIGAVGTSGGSSAQDDEVALACLRALGN